jgi:hypothetical protein
MALVSPGGKPAAAGVPDRPDQAAQAAGPAVALLAPPEASCRTYAFRFTNINAAVRYLGDFASTGSRNCSGGVHVEFVSLQRTTTLWVARADTLTRIGPKVTFRRAHQRQQLYCCFTGRFVFKLAVDGSAGVPARYTIDGRLYY